MAMDKSPAQERPKTNKEIIKRNVITWISYGNKFFLVI